MDQTREIAYDVASSLKIADRIKNIYIEETVSPWNEKALIKRKKDHLDVKITVWEDSLFLYGRILRLFLYVHDVLSPDFRYQPETGPDEDKEPKLKNRHNQIWTIYVDSRVEREGVEAFFDKSVRRNIFIDAERELSWGEAGAIFERLWNKENYNYQEITGYAYNIERLKEGVADEPQRLEVELNRFFLEPSVRTHVEKISSSAFKDSVDELLSFAAYNCKDTHVEPSHFGITLTYQKRVFMEMIPTKKNTMLLTLLDAASNTYSTTTVQADSDISEVQRHIKETYSRLAVEQHF